MQSYKETSQKVSTSAMQDKFRTPRPHLKSRHLEIILDVEGEWGGKKANQVEQADLENFAYLSKIPCCAPDFGSFLILNIK